MLTSRNIKFFGQRQISHTEMIQRLEARVEFIRGLMSDMFLERLDSTPCVPIKPKWEHEPYSVGAIKDAERAEWIYLNPQAISERVNLSASSRGLFIPIWKNTIQSIKFGDGGRVGSELVGLMQDDASNNGLGFVHALISNQAFKEDKPNLIINVSSFSVGQMVGLGIFDPMTLWVQLGLIVTRWEERRNKLAEESRKAAQIIRFEDSLMFTATSIVR